jgi:hypothetical protein
LKPTYFKFELFMKPQYLATDFYPNEKINLIDVLLSSAFQKLEEEQQQRIKTIIEALRMGVDVFKKVSLQQAKDIEDSNKLEHERTRAHGSVNHDETRDLIKIESEASRLSALKEAQETRYSVSIEHHATRAGISAGEEATRNLVVSKAEESSRIGKSEHATRMEVVSAVNEQIVATELALEKDLRRTQPTLSKLNYSGLN